MEENFKRKSTKEKIVLWIVFGVFVVYAISLLIPFVWAFFSSLKTDDEYYGRVFSWPKDWLFSNYINAFSQFKVGKVTFAQMFLNSVWLAIGGTLVSVMVTSMTAYTVAKYEFFGSKFLYKLAIFLMVIPIVGNLPATYRLVVSAGLDNPVGILVLWTGGFGMNFVILHGAYKSVSWTYAEAAFMDGASDSRVYWSIMLPQAVPVLVSLGVLSFIGVWNDYQTPFLYLRKTPTLALGIYQFDLMQQYRSNIPVYYCGVLMSIVPVLLLYCFMQKTILQNTVAGGLKG